MVRWIIGFLIVFSVFQLEYVTTDRGHSWGNFSRPSEEHRLLTERHRRNSAKANIEKQLAKKSEHKTEVGNKAKTETKVEGNDPCIANPCVNGGTCKQKSGKDFSFTCKCALGYTGTLCSVSVPQCETQPCNPGGRCVATESGFACVCKDGYSGKLCEKVESKKKNLTVIVLTQEEVEEAEIGSGIFVGFLFLIILCSAIHCFRVKKRREEMAEQYYLMLKGNEDNPPPLPPGVCEVSKLLCNEILCAFCKQSETVETYVKASKAQLVEEKPLLSNRSRSSHSRHGSKRNLSASPISNKSSGSRAHLNANLSASRVRSVSVRRIDSMNSLASDDSKRLLPQVQTNKESVKNLVKKWSYVDPENLETITSRRRFLKEDSSGSRQDDGEFMQIGAAAFDAVRQQRKASTARLSSVSLQHTDIPPRPAMPPPPPPL